MNDAQAVAFIIPDCASYATVADTGEYRIVVCDPKLYHHTARGRKRREENEYK